MKWATTHFILNPLDHGGYIDYIYFSEKRH